MNGRELLHLLFARLHCAPASRTMVKLDAYVLKYLSKDDFRVLTAIEMGMKNHDLVPTTLINSLSNLKFGMPRVLLDLVRQNVNDLSG